MQSQICLCFGFVPYVTVNIFSHFSLVFTYITIYSTFIFNEVILIFTRLIQNHQPAKFLDSTYSSILQKMAASSGSIVLLHWYLLTIIFVLMFAITQLSVSICPFSEKASYKLLPGC